jgi:asparagine synthase (glutamine-hydrolysing)
MCGIVGFWDLKQRSTQEQLHSTITNMRDTLTHRGPDGSGNWVDAVADVAFGHRRLAILDLTDHGQQPMRSASCRYVITYNGEIYNHQEIKQELAAANYNIEWQGHSDTEVILAAFEAWGVDAAVQKFVGMFAIALWDSQEKLLYLIRDRIGEKPLYYGWINDYLLFGSELKSLKEHPAWQQNINKDAVGLLLQYNCIPAPHTIYEDIYKLQPGHMLVINKDKHVKEFEYWQLKNIINDLSSKRVYVDPNNAVDALEAKLKEAVRLQMLADVPVGAFLSGGIDSSTIAALMQAQSSKSVKTFTIGFDDPAYNEAEHAKAIAKHLGTQHTELYLSPQQTLNIIPNLSNFYDEPFSDSSQLPTYIISKLTREHVTVSLSGDGGDELFAGYNRYTWAPNIWNKIAYLPRNLRVLLSKMLLVLTPAQWNKIFTCFGILSQPILGQRNPGDKLHKLASLLDSASVYDIYRKLLMHWDIAQEDLLLKPLLADLNGSSVVENMMYIDTKRYLPDDILVKVDRAAMAVGLETRIPFLDHRVVEFAWSLPLDLKIRNGQSKWILRQVLNKHVPVELYDRPKMGFSVPIDQWLRGPLHEWAQDLLTEPMLAKHGLLNSKEIRTKWREHLSGARNWQYHLWDVLIFQSWYGANYG